MSLGAGALVSRCGFLSFYFFIISEIFLENIVCTYNVFWSCSPSQLLLDCSFPLPKVIFAHSLLLYTWKTIFFHRVTPLPLLLWFSHSVSPTCFCWSRVPLVLQGVSLRKPSWYTMQQPRVLCSAGLSLTFRGVGRVAGCVGRFYMHDKLFVISRPIDLYW